jgi:peptidoglycan hydrolase CwlO-like protein
MKKIILGFLSLLLISYLISFTSHVTLAQSCSSEADCQRLIKDYESKLGSLREQKNTLASQVQFFDTQIYLATLRIQDTEQKIKKTEDEIQNLGGKIEGLNNSLDHVGKLLIKKIAEDYKRRDVPLISVFINSDDASTLVNRMKYAKSAQESDQKLAFQVQQAKQNFQDQKDLREQKKADLDKLISTLDSQKASLGTQKTQKQKLLADTQSDESTYQRFLQQAQTQLSGFKSFVQSAGAELLAPALSVAVQTVRIIPSATRGGRE